MNETNQPSIQIHVPGTLTSGWVAILEMAERPGQEPPCHLHHWEDEVMYLLAGKLAVFMGGTWQRLAVGTALVIPRRTEHTHAVMAAEARWLTLYAPAGFEQVYRETGSQTPWASKNAHEVERWVATAAQFGCEITGPHPGRPVF